MPLSGGTLTNILWATGGYGFLTANDKFVQLGSNPVTNNATSNRNISVFNIANTPDIKRAVRLNSGSSGYTIFGEHNKPVFDYTGNGSTDVRTIDTGGMGNICSVNSDNGFAFVTPRGAIICNGTSVDCLSSVACVFNNGTLSLGTDNIQLNKSNIKYRINVL